jgi:cytochrome P450
MVDYNPFHPSVIADPHKAYKQLRQEAPVYFLGRSGDVDWNTWFFSRFDDIWEASMDAEHYSTEAGTTIAQLVTKVQPLTPMLNNMDPPRHTKLRSCPVSLIPRRYPMGIPIPFVDRSGESNIQL